MEKERSVKDTEVAVFRQEGNGGRKDGEGRCKKRTEKRRDDKRKKGMTGGKEKRKKGRKEGRWRRWSEERSELIVCLVPPAARRGRHEIKLAGLKQKQLFSGLTLSSGSTSSV